MITRPVNPSKTPTDLTTSSDPLGSGLPAAIDLLSASAYISIASATSPTNEIAGSIFVQSLQLYGGCFIFAITSATNFVVEFNGSASIIKNFRAARRARASLPSAGACLSFHISAKIGQLKFGS
ncbi:unnamed protein product [Haemonchus placei]|uniref:7TM_GPCR_Srx domain-containing protein n=1 Tax=Haemonchus placei TaxID=6290 RepID=A0A0N4X491_HAEPC|nr:unnamed protein product [Haemonchus placei]